MVNFDASTPQLKTVKKLCDAYLSLNMNDAEPFLSKNYQYEAFPESTDLPKQTKESHLQTWGGVFSLVNKHEVRIRHRRTAFKLRSMSTTSRLFITK